MDGGGLGSLVVARAVGRDGPEVVFVPGLAVSRYLHATQDLLGDEARTHVSSYPGTGSAPNAAKRRLGLTADVAAVSSWLEQNVTGPVVLVGHSYGALVAPQVAVAAPSRVGALVLASPVVDPAYRSVPKLALRFLRNGTHEPGRLARLQLGEQRRAGVRRLAAMAWSMLGDDPERWLAVTPVPVTVVRGSLDALCTRRWAEQLASRPGGSYVEVPDVPHAFPFDHPAALADAIRATLVRTMP